mmetsp:Transcript_64048/g.119018  ORF Transcript_64048/g.119018 Transcript_64048/m.119018 type:complete len:205 (-) Transcript_64048:342-956(-)
MHILQRGALLELRKSQWHGHDHALTEVSNGRAKDGLLVQSSALLHLWKMLVRQTKAIRAPRLVILVLEDLYQSFATTAIATDSMNNERGVFWQKSGISQRPDQSNEACRIATWICYSLRCCDCFSVCGSHFWKPIHPVIADSVGRASINQNGVEVLTHGHCSYSSIIREAKHRGICLFEGFSSGICILAKLRSYAQQLYLWMPL